MQGLPSMLYLFRILPRFEHCRKGARAQLARQYQPQHWRKHVSDAIEREWQEAALRNLGHPGRTMGLVTYAAIAAAGAVCTRVLLTVTGFPVDNAGTPCCEAA